MSTTHKRSRKKIEQPKRPLLPLVLMLAGILVVGAGIALAIFSLGSAGRGTPSLKVGQLQASPKATIDGLKVDFSVMKLGGESASVVVNLTNTGDGAIRFTEEPYVEVAEGC